MNTLMMLAQAATQPTSKPAPGWAQLLNSPLFPLIVGIALLYFFMSRSKRTEQKKREQMLAELKRGARVQTIGGILANVVEAREDKVLLKVDETSNTKIWFSRSAIHRVLEDEKSDVK